MKFTLAYSPCPNDCFIFDALVHQKIDTEGFDFDVVLADVESLNQSAFRSEYDITKLSFHAYAYVLKDYILLNSGSALGFNCGPLLITRPELVNEKVDDMQVAIPGKMTTANFLLSLAYPSLKNKTVFLFSDIEEAVISGKVEAGLIIHESRFTYEKKGLKKIIDLGEFWDRMIHAPIPLGGIAVKRNIETEIQKKIDRLVKKSVEFAFANPESSMPYVREHAQAMDEAVMKKHIDLYVNKYSVDLGAEGVRAIELMFAKAKELKLFNFGKEKLILSP